MSVKQFQIHTFLDKNTKTGFIPILYKKEEVDLVALFLLLPEDFLFFTEHPIYVLFIHYSSLICVEHTIQLCRNREAVLFVNLPTCNRFQCSQGEIFILLCLGKLLRFRTF